MAAREPASVALRPLKRRGPARTRVRLLDARGQVWFEFALPALRLYQLAPIFALGLGLITLATLFSATAGGEWTDLDAAAGGDLESEFVEDQNAFFEFRTRLDQFRRLQATIASRTRPDAGPASFLEFANLGFIDGKGRDVVDTAPIVAELLEARTLYLENENFPIVYATVLRDFPHAAPLETETLRVNSQYGYRANPFYARSARPDFHAGVDLKAAHGVPVTSAAAGFVRLVRRSNTGYGNMIRVVHLSGYETLYAHLSEIQVREGQAVKPGQRLGRAGSSGLVTGPHLHFEVRLQNQPIDPTPFLPDGE